MKSLSGKVAIVAGSTRRAGRGIAIELGLAGATVYCTGRSTRDQRSDRGEPGSIEETAELVREFGGTAHWARVDHTDVESVRGLVDRVVLEQGRLDILVNATSGNATNDAFLTSDLSKELNAIWNGGRSHIIATYFAAQKMVEAGSGLIVSVSDKEWDAYYAIEKSIINRLAPSLAEEFRPKGVAIVSLFPGAFFHNFDVMTEVEMEANLQENPNASKCHTPRLIGRAVVALAQDPAVMKKSGQRLEILDLIKEYGFTDIDGRTSGEMW